MNEEEYLQDMFCKIAMISFHRSLEDRGIGFFMDPEQTIKIAEQGTLFDIPQESNLPAVLKPKIDSRFRSPPGGGGAPAGKLFDVKSPGVMERLRGAYDSARGYMKRMMASGSQGQLFTGLEGGEKLKKSKMMPGLPEKGLGEMARETAKNIGEGIKSIPGRAAGLAKSWWKEGPRDPFQRSSGQRTLFAETSPGRLMQEGLTAKGKSLGSTLASGARNIKAQLLHGTTEMNPQKGIMPSIGRGATRAMAAMQIANIGSNILRKRQKDEGFFESLGRRTGNIGETLVGTAAGATPYTRALSTLGKAKTIASVGGSVARAAGFNRAAKALESLPGVGDIGASVGRQIDTGLAGARKAGLEARQRFGGGISYQQQKAQALDGQQFKHKAEYQ